MSPLSMSTTSTSPPLPTLYHSFNTSPSSLSISPLPRPSRCLTPYPTESFPARSTSPSPLSSPHPYFALRTAKPRATSLNPYNVPPSLRMSTIPTSPTDEAPNVLELPFIRSPQDRAKGLINVKRSPTLNRLSREDRKKGRPQPIFVPRITHSVSTNLQLATPLMHKSAPIRTLPISSASPSASIKINSPPASTPISKRMTRSLHPSPVLAGSVPNPKTPSTPSSGGRTAKPGSGLITAIRIDGSVEGWVDQSVSLGSTFQRLGLGRRKVEFEVDTLAGDIPMLSDRPSPGWGDFGSVQPEHDVIVTAEGI